MLWGRTRVFLAALEEVFPLANLEGVSALLRDLHLLGELGFLRIEDDEEA
jgi:hypothetical protein